jgi:hypothetical protein
MENRIGRKDDEALYQPRIHSDRIKTLYNLKKATGKPMTVLLDPAIRNFAESSGVIYQFEEEPDLKNVEVETWEGICEYRELLDKLDYFKYLDEVAELITNEQRKDTN